MTLLLMIQTEAFFFFFFSLGASCLFPHSCLPGPGRALYSCFTKRTPSLLHVRYLQQRLLNNVTVVTNNHTIQHAVLTSTYPHKLHKTDIIFIYKPSCKAWNKKRAKNTKNNSCACTINAINGLVLATMPCAPPLLFWFPREQSVYIVKEFDSGRKQKPQNFQHHKKMATKKSQCAMLNGQYRVFKSVATFPRKIS